MSNNIPRAFAILREDIEDTTNINVELSETELLLIWDALNEQYKDMLSESEFDMNSEDNKKRYKLAAEKSATLRDSKIATSIKKIRGAAV